MRIYIKPDLSALFGAIVCVVTGSSVDFMGHLDDSWKRMFDMNFQFAIWNPVGTNLISHFSWWSIYRQWTSDFERKSGWKKCSSSKKYAIKYSTRTRSDERQCYTRPLTCTHSTIFSWHMKSVSHKSVNKLLNGIKVNYTCLHTMSHLVDGSVSGIACTQREWWCKKRARESKREREWDTNRFFFIQPFANIVDNSSRRSAMFV